MPTDSEDIAQYFSSLNGLTKKLSVAVQSGEEWLQSSDEPGSESLLEILKIKSGEKIVVDFENEDVSNLPIILLIPSSIFFCFSFVLW